MMTGENAMKVRKANNELLVHEQKRKVENELLKLEERLEALEIVIASLKGLLYGISTRLGHDHACFLQQDELLSAGMPESEVQPRTESRNGSEKGHAMQG